MRGARNSNTSLAMWLGIIPACAGSTAALRSRSVDYRDHPRMCGEHRLVERPADLEQGSSPHVRGAPYHVRRTWWRRGIIPACAGSTCRIRLLPASRRDHPRMCGEHSVFVARITLKLGSSPHVRGALQIALVNIRGQGIIPACAGSTAAKAADCSDARDHPRMCGEHE